MGTQVRAFIVCAVMFVAGIVHGHAGETSIKAWAVWQGQGRFYQATETLALFSGHFEGIMEVENKQGDLNAANMICPGTLEIDLTDVTQRGWGRCIIIASGGDRVYAGWQCTGKHLEGCGGQFTISGGTGKYRTISGESTFMVRSSVAEYVMNIPKGGVTANFTGQAAWSALTYTTP